MPAERSLVEAPLVESANGIVRSNDIGEDNLVSFDPEEIVTLYGQGLMTLRTAVEQVMAQKPHDLDAMIFRDSEPIVLDLAQIEKIAAEWG